MSSVRAQSEVISSILMAAIVVLAVGAFGVGYLGQLEDRGEDVNSNLRTRVASDRVTVGHNGGDTLDTDTTRVIVIVNGSTEIDNSLAAAPDSDLTGSDDSRFEPGERWNWTAHTPPYGPETEVRVFLGDNRTGTVLYDEVLQPTSDPGF